MGRYGVRLGALTLLLMAGVVAGSRTTAHAHGRLGASPARCPKRNQAHGVITYSDNFLPTTMNPFFSAGGGLFLALFDNLFLYAPNGKTQTMMASELPTVRNGGIRDGGRTILIHLKAAYAGPTTARSRPQT